MGRKEHVRLSKKKELKKQLRDLKEKKEKIR
jgi:hypothetical protein